MYDVQFGIFGVQILHDSSYCAYMSYPKTSEIFLDFCLSFAIQGFLKVETFFKSLVMSLDICFNWKGILVQILVLLLAQKPNTLCVQQICFIMEAMHSSRTTSKVVSWDSGECCVSQLPQKSY